MHRPVHRGALVALLAFALLFPAVSHAADDDETADGIRRLGMYAACTLSVAKTRDLLGLIGAFSLCVSLYLNEVR